MECEKEEMKNRIARMAVGVLLTVFIFGPLSALAEEGKPLAPGEGTTVAHADKDEVDLFAASADVSFLSQYIWRGYELSKDSLVIQPSVTVGYKGFSLNLWGNFDTDCYEGPHKDNAKWNETDLTVAYETNFGPVGVGVGYLYYAVDGEDDTQEFYASVGGDVFLAPTFTVYRDVDEYHGWYFNLGISHSFDLPNRITLDLAGSVAYGISDNDSTMNYDNNLNETTDRFNNFQDGLVSVGLSIPFLKYFTAAPVIAYSFPLGNAADNMLKATSLSHSAAHLFGGVNLSVEF